MKRFIKNKRINNTWAIVPIKEVPDNAPVLGVVPYINKSFANFSLVEYCLLPKELADKISAKKPINKKTK